jgi:hypothetical protein
LPDALERLIGAIGAKGYHNHRGQEHSTLLCKFIEADLSAECDVFRQDLASKAVRGYPDFNTPGARGRRADLVVSEPDPDDPDRPNLKRLRLCIENKSVITAHRNAPARFDDLTEVLGVLHREKPDAIFVATVLIGVSKQVLNVPDGVKRRFKGGREAEFEGKVRPRLSSGDTSLWTEFASDVSPNRPDDPARSVDLFRKLPVRGRALTHLLGYDYVLLVPVEIDNVNPPRLAPAGTLGIDALSDYRAMIAQICQAYRVRFH